MDVRVVEDIAGLRQEWIKLLERSETGTMFQQPIFLETWWERFKNGLVERLILASYDGDQLVGVGAFEVEKNLVRFLGMRKVLGDPPSPEATARRGPPSPGGHRDSARRGEEVTDYGDVVARRGREEEVWREFISYIRNSYASHRLGRSFSQAQNHISDSELVFDYIREESPSFEILPRLAGELGFTIHQEKQDVAPFLTLSRSWEEYIASLPRKKRHELRRKIRRFEEGQTVTFKVLDQAGETERTAFVKLMRASSEEKRAFMSGEMAAFFGKLIENSMTEKLGLLAFLEVDKKQLGAVFLLKEGKKLLGYNGGAPTLAGQAVGVMMTAKVIEWAIEHEFTEFDFLRGGERYKYDLGAQDRQLWQVRLESH